VAVSVGLTGGIGAGKSAVARRLSELGAVVIDADALAREVVAKGTDGLAAVVEAFGPGVLGADGEMDRAAVAQIVFGQPERLRQLEGIIHPRVRARSTELVASAAPDAVIVHDIPLLAEAPREGARFDLVLVVEASEQIRLDRLTGLRGMTEDAARARFAAQASDEQRRAIADVVIENNGTLEALRDAVDAVWRERIEPLRHGDERAARGSR
jgi:dephospho-CoA kinase